jgi:hypothetical protein
MNNQQPDNNDNRATTTAAFATRFSFITALSFSATKTLLAAYDSAILDFINFLCN